MSTECTHLVLACQKDCAYFLIVPKKVPDSAPADLRTYVNPKPGKPPKFTADWQREVMPTGPNVTEYLETPKLKTFDGLLGSIRPGSVVVVRRLFLLAPWAGSPTIRKRTMAKRVDAIKARGGTILEAETGRRSDSGVCAQMIADGIADIASGGRRNVTGKMGRPSIGYTEDQLDAMERIWHSRRYPTTKAAWEAISASGIRVTRSWLYNRFGKPGEGKEPPVPGGPDKPPKRLRTWVYFIRDEARVKIGYSYDPHRRIREIKTHSPIELLAVVLGGPARERRLHRKFAAHRIDGTREWFHLVDEIRDFIANHGRQL